MLEAASMRLGTPVTWLEIIGFALALGCVVSAVLGQLCWDRAALAGCPV